MKHVKVVTLENKKNAKVKFGPYKVQVNATPTKVWSVLVDLKIMQDWYPEVKVHFVYSIQSFSTNFVFSRFLLKHLHHSVWDQSSKQPLIF
jgi:hypothetical protein